MRQGISTVELRAEFRYDKSGSSTPAFYKTATALTNLTPDSDHLSEFALQGVYKFSLPPAAPPKPGDPPQNTISAGAEDGSEMGAYARDRNPIRARSGWQAERQSAADINRTRQRCCANR